MIPSGNSCGGAELEEGGGRGIAPHIPAPGVKERPRIYQGALRKEAVQIAYHGHGGKVVGKMPLWLRDHDFPASLFLGVRLVVFYQVWKDLTRKRDTVNVVRTNAGDDLAGPARVSKAGQSVALVVNLNRPYYRILEI